jgi:hypothetical protein
MFADEICYVDEGTENIIKRDFSLIEDQNGYQLFQSNDDKSYWRLDKWDKYQEQFFVHLPAKENWVEFDASGMQISLLRKTRGENAETCIWNECANHALNGLAYCAEHAFTEMGIRR